MFAGGAAESQDQRIGKGATLHGSEMLQHNFTIEQVVHDYGDLCQSIIQLAVEQGAPITVHEFGMLNNRLDSAIANAVTEYARQHERFRADVAMATNERLGMLGAEMRNLLNTTIVAISAIKRGSVGFGGATAAALDRSLIGMRALIDRTLAEVRLEEGSATFDEVIEIGPFVADMQVAATLEATTRGCEMSVGVVEPGIFVQSDRHILASAVANLLQNAFKFSCGDCHVVLRAYASQGRVLIEIEDNGVGIGDAVAEQLRQPTERAGGDRAGVGMVLSIGRKAVEALGGTLVARNIPGAGCVFTIDLPQKKAA
jgi:signal transduction histidine kinase